MKRLLILFSFIIFCASCADNKTLILNGREKTFEPYGVVDVDRIKNDSIVYGICGQNVFWDVILSETIIVPIWLIGWQAYEPVEVKKEYLKKNE